MRKCIAYLLSVSLLAWGLPVLSDSFIRVINNSSETLQAIWQAGACVDVVRSWGEDEQFTVCKESSIAPGKEGRYDFKWINVDRSVKVYDWDEGRIAYCNSMDYSSVTISEDNNNHFVVEYTCP